MREQQPRQLSGEAITVTIDSHEPRVDIQAKRWPLKGRLLVGLAIMAGLRVGIKGPNFRCTDLQIVEATRRPIHWTDHYFPGEEPDA